MGFFSDLKEDLSQAVNELMPEEALDAAMANSPETEQFIQNVGVAEEVPKTVDSLDISSMLDKLDVTEMPVTVQEETVAATDISYERTEETEELPAAEEAVSEGLTETAVELAEEPVEVLEEVREEPVEEVLQEETLAEVEPAVEAMIETDNIMAQQPDGEEERTMDVQTNRVAVDETAVVTEGMTITGDILSEGSMELIGTVNGNLDIYGKLNITGTIQGNSKAAEIYAEGAKICGEVHSDGSVKIGQSSVVIGNISASSAVIAGAVKGDIDVHGPVILDTTAIVMGNIKSKSVQINNGAVIEGLCSQCYADISPSTFFEEFKKNKDK